MKTNKAYRNRTGLCALLMAGVLVFASAGAVYAGEPEVSAEQEETAADERGSSYYEEKEHADLDYADMVYESVNPEALDALIAELDGITEEKETVENPEQRTVEIYREMLQIMNEEYTHYVLGDIQHYRNVNDEEMSERNRQDTLAIQDMSDAAYISLQKALMGPYGSELRKEFSDDQMDELEEYEALTERERELTDRETELQQEYDRLSEEDYSYTYKGKTWTLDDISNDPPEDYDDVVAVYLGVTKAMNDALVPVYQVMVETRKEIAELEGYDT